MVYRAVCLLVGSAALNEHHSRSLREGSAISFGVLNCIFILLI